MVILEALIVFVNLQNSDRSPAMISKQWSVNRCKTALLEASGLKASDSSSYVLYSEDDDSNLVLLALDSKAEQCLHDMHDVHLLLV